LIFDLIVKQKEKKKKMFELLSSLSIC